MVFLGVRLQFLFPASLAPVASWLSLLAAFRRKVLDGDGANVDALRSDLTGGTGDSGPNGRLWLLEFVVLGAFGLFARP